MTYRAPLLLMLLVLLPVLLLGWLGLRLQHNEQQLVGLQLQSLIEQQLQSVDQQLQTHFRQLEGVLQQQAQHLRGQADPDYDADQLRAFVKGSAYVKQLFVLGDDGSERLFPPRFGPLSQAEQRLVEQMQPLWQSADLFQPTAADPVTSSPPAVDSGERKGVAGEVSSYLARGQLRAPSVQADLSLAMADSASPAARAEASPASGPSGWIAWHANSGLMQVFWWRDDQGRTLGFVLNSARLLSDLINRLPEGGQGDAQLGNAEIRLLDSRGSTLYGWGEYRAQDKAQQLLGLSHPLGSWRLEYHGPAGSEAVAPGWLTLGVPLLLLALGLSLLGYLLYLEHGRELRLARQRVNFVNQVSHELKTPLTNVRLYAEMLQERLADDEQDKGVLRYLDVITGESQRLSRLIDNVLSFSRLQRQQLRLRYEPAEVDEQIERIVQTFVPLLRQRGIEAQFSAGIGATLRYDAGALEQILNNLLSNCEKYAANSGVLQVASWQQGADLCIRVQDRGPGIEAAEQQRIFEPFYRSSNRLTDGVAGTGIGLGLARELARAHGGDLSLEPSAEGACFLIRLETKPGEKP
ncbi:sensor histidine kinase [Marinobacterium rhizophilum]|uniref:histidine kinase n=1 Tax=Marinobacterium rhizophilum TaxID=420402 RepID=A0ABY5HH43_9GAMM|nr:HAMP domain-containing sensor histidine kinase [Marinobacterium rhizophilum]UTW11156.1 HAMP domain-containing histidine kinase [Marinobacterium rhizophilum]